MIRVMVGFWIIAMAMTSLIAFLDYADFRTKLLFLGGMGAFLGTLLFGAYLLVG